MEIPPSCSRLFTQPIVVLNQAALQRPPWGQVIRDAAQMINQIGDRSAIAQGLVGPHNRPNPITTANNLGETEARLDVRQERGGATAAALDAIAAAKQRRADAQREADSVVKEKQLRKTATRAVVALFNAVAKHQHPDDFQDR